MTYNHLEKTAVVLNLMGESFAESILSKLPREIVERIQQEVIPLMDQVQMPSDIDAFVFDEIVRDNVAAQPIDIVNIDNFSETPAISLNTWDPLGCDDETLLNLVDVDVAINVLIAENRAFQSILLGFFPEPKQTLLLEKLKQRKMQLPNRVVSTAIMEKMESSMKQSFLAKLRVEASQNLRRE